MELKAGQPLNDVSPDCLQISIIDVSLEAALCLKGALQSHQQRHCILVHQKYSTSQKFGHTYSFKAFSLFFIIFYIVE